MQIGGGFARTRRNGDGNSRSPVEGSDVRSRIGCETAQRPDRGLSRFLSGFISLAFGLHRKRAVRNSRMVSPLRSFRVVSRRPWQVFNAPTMRPEHRSNFIDHTPICQGSVEREKIIFWRSNHYEN